MKKIVSVVFILLLLLGTQAAALADSQSYSEGVNSPCKVRFAPYNGPHRDMFLSEGDRIAVISPSALPSRDQVDATVNGLRSWGYIPVEGKHVCDKVRSKEDCLEDLRWALEDPSIKAVFCVR
ncbi:MAG: LD-carboxypeptidase, partial [Verrucomicrobia bacterium]|nr:LD-carboxypeptidase [Verrucomicrobiota bacterium]